MALDISRICALCFDVDGTLCDTDDQLVQKFENVFRPARFLFPGKESVSASRWLAMNLETPGNFLYHCADCLNIDDKIARLFNHFEQHNIGPRQKPYIIIPRVREAIIRLAQMYPLAIVSARDQKSTLTFLKQFDLEDFFQCIATAQTCQYTKPFPDPIFWVASQMNIHPQNILMVGDTVVDIHAGRAAGAQTVGVLCGFGQEKELKRAGADLILPSTADLMECLYHHE